MRYQTTHKRGFHKCLSELLKVRAEKRKQRLDEAALSQRAEDSNKIGFESQERKRKEEARKEAEEARKQANENRREAAEERKQNLHRLDVLLAEAKVNHQYVLTSLAQMPALEAPARQEARAKAERAA